jgi:magnesium transporter
MIVGSGGNAGNQPGVMVTRALGLGEFNKPGLLRAFVRREGAVIAVIATILAVFSFLRVLVEYPDDAKSALAISLAMWSVVAVSVFLGIGFSVVMDRYGIDPAAGSAPTLTTIADLLGITILCLMALMVLGN